MFMSGVMVVRLKKPPLKLMKLRLPKLVPILLLLLIGFIVILLGMNFVLQLLLLKLIPLVATCSLLLTELSFVLVRQLC